MIHLTHRRFPVLPVPRKRNDPNAVRSRRKLRKKGNGTGRVTNFPVAFAEWLPEETKSREKEAQRARLLNRGRPSSGLSCDRGCASHAALEIKCNFRSYDSKTVLLHRRSTVGILLRRSDITTCFYPCFTPLSLLIFLSRSHRVGIHIRIFQSGD